MAEMGHFRLLAHCSIAACFTSVSKTFGRGMARVREVKSASSPKSNAQSPVLHQPFVRPDEVKWGLAGQRAAAVLNCAAQTDVVRASALCRVVR
jgi:hypothetical protein